jgi:hypothetical protein
MILVFDCSCKKTPRIVLYATTINIVSVFFYFGLLGFGLVFLLLLVHLEIVHSVVRVSHAELTCPSCICVQNLV